MFKSRISALPNYCNGKLYSRWDRVTNVFGEKSLLAIKRNKKGETVELLISEDGKRELFTNDYKIMDIIGDDRVKRTYTYQKTKDGIVGRMSVDESNETKPLITAAKWLVKNFVPQEVNLTLNTNHPKATMYVPDVKVIEDLMNSKPIVVKNIKATNFSKDIKSLPSKLEMTSVDGKVAVSDSPETGSIFASKYRATKPETHPMEHINVVV